MKKIAFVLSAAGLMSACNGEPPIDNAVAVDCVQKPQGLLSQKPTAETEYGKPADNAAETAAVCPDEEFFNTQAGNAS